MTSSYFRSSFNLRRQAASSLRIAAAAFVMLLVSAPGADGEDVTYRTHVRKVLRDHCAGCHNTTRPRAGLDLSSYAGVIQGSTSGSIVAAGDPDDSLLYLSMTHQEEPFMPPGKDPLETEITDVVRTWIRNGLPETPDDMESARAKVAAVVPANRSTQTAGAGSVSGAPNEMEEAARMSDAEVSGADPTTAAGRAPESDSDAALVFRGRRPTALTSLAVSASGRLAAIGGQLQVLVFDLESGTLAQVLPFPEGEPAVIRFCGGDTNLVVGGGVPAESGRVVVWNVATWERVREFGDEFDTVMAADISPESTTVLLGGPERIVKVIDYETGQTRSILRKHTDWVLQTSFSPEGLLFATTDRAGNVYVWESETAADLHTLRGHRGSVNAVAWSLDSNHCFTGGEDGTVRSWNMHDGQQAASWHAHAEGVLGMDVSAAGTIVTCGRDMMVRCWSDNGTLQSETAVKSLPLRVAFAPSEQIFVGTWAGDVLAWKPGQETALAAMEIPADRITSDVAQLNLEVEHPEMPLIADVSESSSVPADAASDGSGTTDSTAAGDGSQEVYEALAAGVRIAPIAVRQLRNSETRMQEASQRLDRLAAVMSPGGGEYAAAHRRMQALTRIASSLKQAHREASTLGGDAPGLADAELLTRLALEKATAEMEQLREQYPDVLAGTAASGEQQNVSYRPGDGADISALQSEARQSVAAVEQQLDEASASLQTLASAVQTLSAFLTESQARLQQLQHDLEATKTRAEAAVAAPPIASDNATIDVMTSTLPSR